MRYFVLLLTVVLLQACGNSSGPSTTSLGIGSADAAAATAAVFPLLKATRGTNPGVYDDQGRFVLLRGVNYTSLGDYYIQYPENPTPVPAKAGDYAQMAALGMNSIRLIVHWSALEPVPGQYSSAYLARIREQVRLAAAQGLYVILDMHQDAWGKYISSRDLGDGASCVPPLAQAVGWDGAPQWATITDGQLSCRVAQRELSGATAQSFTNFYNDRNGIQTRFIAMWQRLVREFASDRNVAGYDIFNEPHPGFFPQADAALLTPFYGNLITAIRAAEKSTPGGLEHIVFFEPSIEWSLAGETATVPPNFTADTNIVFAPHNYCGTFNQLPPSQCFANSKTHSDLYGITFFSGEWGFYGDLAAAAAPMITFANLEDQYRVGGSFWVWEQACGDPHSLQPLSPTTSGIGTVPAETVSVKRLKCPGQEDQGAVVQYTLPLSRAYPKAAPGVLSSLVADVVKGTLDLTGQTSNPGTLEAWVPARIGTPTVTGSNIGPVTLHAVPGGWQLRIPVQGTYQLQVR